MLPSKIFKMAVEHLPLFAIDLCVINKEKEILLGRRLNAPAKGFWFVPGGRVFKNESLDAAFGRVSFDELGVVLKYENASLLGIYDHFYPDSAFSDTISTHYINATHVIELDVKITKLPCLQHSEYRWFSLKHLVDDECVHMYSKVFINALMDYLNHEK